jgi:hypothetical protein
MNLWQGGRANPLDAAIDARLMIANLTTLFLGGEPFSLQLGPTLYHLVHLVRRASGLSSTSQHSLTASPKKRRAKLAVGWRCNSHQPIKDYSANKGLFVKLTGRASGVASSAFFQSTPTPTRNNEPGCSSGRAVKARHVKLLMRAPQEPRAPTSRRGPHAGAREPAAVGQLRQCN